MLLPVSHAESSKLLRLVMVSSQQQMQGLRSLAGRLMPRLPSPSGLGGLLSRVVGMGNEGLAACQQQQVRGMANHRHKKIIKMAKGYRGRTNCFRIAVQRVEKALLYAYRDRKVKKREFRSLWIQRINAAVQQHGLSYNRFIPALNLANITMNRKVLADLAVTEPYSFKAVVDTAKSAGAKA